MELMPLVAHWDWQLDVVGGIIRSDSGRCPVCALAYEVDPSISYYTIAAWALRDMLQIREFPNAVRDELMEVIDAADRVNSPHRKYLMELLEMT
jgi:hypothetical protein